MNNARADDGPTPAWRRWLARLAAIDERLFLSAGEIQDYRLARIEAQMAELRAHCFGESKEAGR